MKKLILLLAFAVLPLMAAAQQESVLLVYDAQRTTGKIRVDGRLNEPDWQKAAVSEDFSDIRGAGYPVPAKKTNVRMLWNDDYLYIGATLEEDDITGSITVRDEVIWHDNDFEVFLDPFCDGQLYFELENNALGTVMDLLMTKPYGEGGTFILDWDIKGLKLATHCEGTLNKSSDKDRAWYVEIAIPFSSLNREFTNSRVNKVWRVNFSRVEWVLKDGPEENWVWAPTGKVDIHIPGQWGYLRFCDGDAVPELPMN